MSVAHMAYRYIRATHDILTDGVTIWLRNLAANTVMELEGNAFQLLDNLTKATPAPILLWARRDGQKVTTHTFAYFDTNRLVSYIHLGNDVVVRITTGEIETIPTSTEGRLFLHVGDQQPFNIDFQAARACKYGPRLNSESIAYRYFAANFDETKWSSDQSLQFFFARHGSPHAGCWREARTRTAR